MWIASRVILSGMDPADHPCFTQSLRFGIDVAVVGGVAGVLAGQRVEVLACPLGDEPGIAPDLDEPRGVAGSTTSRLTFWLSSRLRPFAAQGSCSPAHTRGLRRPTPW